ncbi:MAG: hypothetical protein WB558_10530 [Terriglobales bacterium]
MSKAKTPTRNAWINWALRHKLIIIADGTSPERLVSWLNGTAGTSSNDRVSRIIELLQKERAIHSLASSRTGAERQRAARLIASISESPLELNDLLLRYWVSPRLMFLEDGPQITYFSTGKTRDTVEMGEIGAVMCVTYLGSRDELDRVRKCQCGKYFLAHRLDQLYCQTKCRVRYHQSTDDFKAKRRKYQREWYHLKKSGKVK